MKKLSEYVKELIIITVSITIAFWVENYRESRKDSSDAKALLSTVGTELNAQDEYLKFIVEYAGKHSDRFDSLVKDLQDCKIEKNQLLIDISIAYVPYISDMSQTSGFESLKNSGLLSNVENDSVITALYRLDSRVKGNLLAYNEAWKKSQEKVRNLLGDIYGSRIEYDFKKSKLLFTKHQPVEITKEQCDKLTFELVAWITIMKQYSVFVDRHREEIASIKPLLVREIR